MARRTKSDTPKRPRQPRGERKPRGAELDPNDRRWLIRIGTRMDAIKVINDKGERPWWGSVKFEGLGMPDSGYFPASSFKTEKRVYHGFAVRWCRDEWFRNTPGARKETHDSVREARMKKLS